MLRIKCPICGWRDETEFSYGGDATVKRPAENETQMQPWLEYVFNRDNPRGATREYWHHDQVCRQWLVLERDTLSQKMGPAVLAREGV